MTGLSGTGEKQNRFTVFVLNALEFLASQNGHVVFFLSGRMRVEFKSYLIGNGLYLVFIGCRSQGVLHQLEMLAAEHSALREGKLKHRICFRLAPVDQLICEVVVRFKGENCPNNLQVVQKTRGDFFQ